MGLKVRTVNCLAFGKQATKEMLFSGGSDATIRMWNVPHEELVGELKCHSKAIQSLAVSEDGSYVSVKRSTKR